MLPNGLNSGNPEREAIQLELDMGRVARRRRAKRLDEAKLRIEGRPSTITLHDEICACASRPLM